MKRTLSMLTLAVLTVGLLGSCSKINERLDGLDKRIDGLENERIASIETQIGSINSSIADLGTIRSNIQSLTTTTESQGKDITDLQAADKALGERIEDLKKYVNDTLKSYATAQWMEATFVTLEQYKLTCDTVAMIDAKLGETSEQLSKDIQACADSLTEWVNTQFKGYYTAAQMDAKLANLKAAIDTASGVSEKTTDSLKTELKKAKADIDTAKAQITRQYTSAITTAITTSEGKLTKALNDAIAKVNDRIDALNIQVTNLNNAVIALEGRVDDLETMIQSVKIIPEYANGSVRVEEDTLYIDCVIAPSAAVEGLTKDKVKILLNRVQTKAVALDTVPTASIKFFKTYKENGTVSIKAHIKKFLDELGDESLTVAVNVKVAHSDKLASDVTSDFVPVKINPILYLPGVFTVGRGPDGLKDTDDDVKVRFSRGNLRAKKIGGQWDWGFYENQYDWNSLYTVANEFGHIESFTGDTEIDHFSWGYGPWSTTPFTDQYVTTHTTDGETLSPSEDWGAAIDNKGTWRTLTSGEWSYLLSYNTTEAEEDNGIPPTEDSSATRSGLYAKCVTVMGKSNCLILYPDGYDKEKVVADGNEDAYDTEEKWRAAQAEGVVCLPAAGCQFLEVYDTKNTFVNGSNFDGAYWSSSYHFDVDQEGNYPYVIGFGSLFDGEAFVPYFLPISTASVVIARHSVRLVTDVK